MTTGTCEASAVARLMCAAACCCALSLGSCGTRIDQASEKRRCPCVVASCLLMLPCGVLWCVGSWGAEAAASLITLTNLSMPTRWDPAVRRL
jgi:hypothetical protein